MLKLSERSRKVLRAIYKGLGVTAVSMAFHACPIETEHGWVEYGMPPDYPVREEFYIRGQVRAIYNDYKPIKGITVIVVDADNTYPYYSTTTYDFGDFYIYVPKQDSYTIIFTDVDGERNGGRFKQLEMTLTMEEVLALKGEPLFINLELEPKSEAEAEESAE